MEGDIEEIEFQDILSCEEIENDIQITENSQVCIYVGECDFPRITVKEFIHMSLVIDELSINSNQNYAKSSTEVYFLLDSSDYKTAEVLYNTFKNGNIFDYFEEVKNNFSEIYTNEFLDNSKTFLLAQFSAPALIFFICI